MKPRSMRRRKGSDQELKQMQQGSRLYRGRNLPTRQRKPRRTPRKLTRQGLARRIYWRRKLQKITLYLLVAAAAIWLLSRLYISDTRLMVAETDVPAPNDYQSIIDQTTGGIYRFKPFFDKGALQSLLESQPVVKQAEVSVPWYGQHVSVRIVESDTRLVWHDGTDNRWFAIDGNGTTFGQITQEQAQGMLLVSDTTPVTTEVGETVLSPMQVEFIRGVSNSLAEKGVETRTVKIGEAARTLVFELHDAGKDKYEIRLTTSREQGEQLEAYWEARSYVNERSLNIDYMDLRVPDKIYYR